MARRLGPGLGADAAPWTWSVASRARGANVTRAAASALSRRACARASRERCRLRRRPRRPRSQTHGARAQTRVDKLSGGERARLALALITRDAPHLLILDEPTNHLDVDAREALIQALNDYSGAVILISHDRHMVELTADRLVLVDDGTARDSCGLHKHVAGLSFGDLAAKVVDDMELRFVGGRALYGRAATSESEQCDDSFMNLGAVEDAAPAENDANTGGIRHCGLQEYGR